MGLLLDNISKSYGDTSVLKDISLNIQEDSFHVILGPSGCGKSTLLSILAGITQPDSGTIYYNGKRGEEIVTKS